MLPISNTKGQQAVSSPRGEEQPAPNTNGLPTAHAKTSKPAPPSGQFKSAPAGQPKAAPTNELKTAAGFAGELSELAKLEDELAKLSEGPAKPDAENPEKPELSDTAMPAGTHDDALAESPYDSPIQPQAEQPKMTTLEAAEQMLRSASIYFPGVNADAAARNTQQNGVEEIARKETVNADLPVVNDIRGTGKDASSTGRDLGAMGRDLEATFSRSNLGLAMQAGGASSNASSSESSNSGANARSALPAGDVFMAEIENAKGFTNATTLATGSTGGNSAAPVAGQTLHAPVLEQAIKLQGPEAKWGEQMLHSLRENVELQVQQRMQSATIRLDPPELGSMEILLKHEAGHLTVQISAAQVDVARLLQQVSERLRQELMEQNFTQVSVEVSSDGESDKQQSRHGRGHLPTDEPVIAGQQGAALQKDKAARPSDVLITV